jgi:sulfite reductase alpha subunit-like flavoprotein
VTPFISILERIQALHAKDVKITMFYGVRNDQECFYYGEFLSLFFNQTNALSGSMLHLACSRDIKTPQNSKGVIKSKGYVQEVAKKYAESVLEPCFGASTKILSCEQENVHVMVCGNKNALGQSAFECLGITPE